MISVGEPLLRLGIHAGRPFVTIVTLCRTSGARACCLDGLLGASATIEHVVVGCPPPPPPPFLLAPSAPRLSMLRDRRVRSAAMRCAQQVISLFAGPAFARIRPTFASFDQIPTDLGQDLERQHSCRFPQIWVELGRHRASFSQIQPHSAERCHVWQHFGQVGRTLVRHGPLLAEFAGVSAARLYDCLGHKRSPSIDKPTTTACAAFAA